MADLIRAGKIRYFGVSNYRAWRVAVICRLCDELGIDRPMVSQPYYNAMNRMPEVEHLPACGYFGLGVVPYSPLARGVLTGKYDPDAPPAEGTRAARQDLRMMQSEWRKEIAWSSPRPSSAMPRPTASRPVQFAFAWVLNNRLVTAAIAGPRTMEQLESYLPALDYRFTAEDEALVDGLVPIGHPSTPGFNDPAYPIEGRPTWSAPATLTSAGLRGVGVDARAGNAVPPAMRHARSYLAALREGFRRGEQEVVSERRVREIEADFAALPGRHHGSAGPYHARRPARGCARCRSRCAG